MEGVGRDIDVGMYEMKAKDLVSTSLMSSQQGMLYSNTEGKIVSMEGVLEYDAVLGKVNVISSKTLDVSSGMLHMSASQKASIVEGVGRDIDIGSYDFRAKSVTAENLVVSDSVLFTGASALLGGDTSFSFERAPHSSGAGTDFTIAGQAAGPSNQKGGDVKIKGGAGGVTNGNGGDVVIQTGAAGGSGIDGDFVVKDATGTSLLKLSNEGVATFMNRVAVKPAAVTTAANIFSSVSSIYFVNDGDGDSASTLPSATGSGVSLKVVIGTTVSSNAIIIKTPHTKFIGHVHNPDTDSAGGMFAPASNSNTITMNGSTTCGKEGDVFVFTDIASQIWLVEGTCAGDTSPVTLFSNS